MTYDVAIVGAGPIGLELAIGLKRAGIEHLVLESGQIGETISQWPPNTHFFSSPERIAIAGVPIPNTDQTKITGEAYLAYLRSVIEQFDVKVNTYERVERIRREVLPPSQRRGEAAGANRMFEITSRTLKGQNRYTSRSVVLATGGLSAPRLLGVRGEDLPHVSHYPADPHRYFRTRVLVVGGRNSALETTLRLFRAGADVSISYRMNAFDPAIPKPHLLAEVSMWIREGRIRFLPATVPVEITPQHVVLAPAEDGRSTGGESALLPVDFVLLCTGFVADMSLFEQLGVSLEGPQRAPKLDPTTMETNVPGVFVAGTVAAGTQERFKAFIETCHVDVERIVAAIRVRAAMG